MTTANYPLPVESAQNTSEITICKYEDDYIYYTYYTIVTILEREEPYKLSWVFRGWGRACVCVCVCVRA